VVWALIWLLIERSSPWLIVGGVSLVGLAADVVWLTYRVRRDERRHTPR
jgi:hypothetical protein